MPPLSWKERLATGNTPVILTFLVALIVWHALFAPYFFPEGAQGMGHDYSFYLPLLLDNYYWIQQNGFLNAYWYSPAFCAGIPAFGDPQGMYYSLPQFYTLFLPPQQAAYLTVLTMVLLGFWGMLVFLRRVLDLPPPLALSGALLFMFNTFFATRMMIGHLAFHGVMLMPWLGAFMLRDFAAGFRWPREVLLALGAALVAAYWVHSGMFVILIPAFLILVGFLGLVMLRNRTPDLLPLAGRSALALLFTVTLTASKITAVLSFLGQFPRNQYKLPGIAALGDQLYLLFRTLFLWPGDAASDIRPRLANVQWALDAHEWHYGISALPLLLVLLVLGEMARQRWQRPAAPEGATIPPEPHSLARDLARLTRWGGGMLLLLVMVIPIALNWYSPEWNAWIKKAPIVGSSSNLIRWWVVIMVLVIPGSLLLARRLPWFMARPWLPPLAAALLIGVQLAGGDWSPFREQTYSPRTVNDGWQAARAEGFSPAIQGIGVYTNKQGKPTMPQQRNEMFIVKGHSSLLCYNPVFGYRLELFSRKGLKIGPATQEESGRLNFKNPACYQFPLDNPCQANGQFTLSQKAELENLLAYHPFAFVKSERQRLADGFASVGGVIMALLVAAALFQRQRRGGAG